MAKSYIQIGAGAGDQDSRAGFRDGFTEHVKSLVLEPMDRVILVEPNPANITALHRCWQAYARAQIYQCGVVPKRLLGQHLTFYHTELDAPHYQVASFDPQHVLRHYPQISHDDLCEQSIRTVDLETLLFFVAADTDIDLLCIDIEGLDAEVILDTDWQHTSVRRISFEHLHMAQAGQAVIQHLSKAGFTSVGRGIDHNGYDTMCVRT